MRAADFLRPSRRRIPPLALLAAALAWAAGSPTVRPVGAQPVFETQWTQMSATVRRGGAAVDAEGAGVPPGPILVDALYESPDLLRYPRSRSLLPEGFASALMSSEAFGGVGVSFWSGSTPDLTATAIWGREIENVGTEAGALTLDYLIPGLEASMLIGPSYAFPPGRRPFMRVEATLLASRYFTSGGSSQWTVFSYILTLERQGFGSGLGAYMVTRSPDLMRDMGDGAPIVDGDVSGILYGPYEGTRELTTLGVGESLFLAYLMEVEVLASHTNTPELGYQGLVGDPFTISGAGFAVRPSTVPEPRAVTLVGAGLAALVAARARARRRYRASSAR